MADAAQPNKVTASAPNLITQAEHARRCKVSRKSVTVWKERGQLVTSGDLVDFERSYKGERWHASTKKAIGEMMTAGAASAAGKTVRVAAPEAGRSEGRQRSSQTGAPIRLRRRDLVQQLAALDWSQTFEWSDDAMRARTVGAANAVGLEAVQSTQQDDGHWGGYQLRDAALMQPHDSVCFDAIRAGYGFELDEFDVLYESRQKLHHPDDTLEDMNDLVEVRLDLLHLLAYPFGPHHRRPEPETDNASRTTP